MRKIIIIMFIALLSLVGCAKLEKITLSESSFSLYVGQSLSLTFETNLDDNTDEEFVWSSSNTSVAIVDNNGKVQGISEGSATITLAGNDKVKSDCIVQVKNVLATALAIMGNNEVGIGESMSLSGSFTPNNTTNKALSWSSSNDTIASVSNGIVSGIKSGSVIISATTVNGVTANYDVSVIKKVTSITITPSTGSIYVGAILTLKVSYQPSDAVNKTVTWVSDNTSVATVVNGVVTGVSPGTATISAVTNNNKISTSLIEVKEKPIIYTGYGDKVINNVNVPDGQYKVIMTHSGSSNFAIWFYEDGAAYGDLLVNEIGSFSGAAVLRDGDQDASSNAQFEITASGSWKIVIERISGSITTNIKGSGTKVSGYFLGNGKRNTVDIRYTGSSNFAVIVYSILGYDALLANEIGSYSGQVTYYTYEGVEYFFYIQSSGSWSIDFNLDEPVTTIK